MKRWAFFLLVIFFLLSGFTYFQKDEMIKELDNVCDVLEGNIARLSGIQERVAALYRGGDPQSSDTETHFSEIKNQISLIRMESDSLFRKVSRKLEDRQKDDFNLYLMVKKLELKDSYRDVAALSGKLDSLLERGLDHKKDEGPVRNEFVKKLLSCFKSQRPAREVHIVCSSGRAMKEEKEDIPSIPEEVRNVMDSYLEGGETAEKATGGKDRTIPAEAEAAEKTVEQALKETSPISYMEYPDYERLDRGKLVYEIATEKGSFCYLAVDGQGHVPIEVRSKDYLHSRVRDALAGRMYQTVHPDGPAGSMQEIVFGGVKYRFSPSLNSYVRIVNDEEMTQCRNVVFQLIKSDHDSDAFIPDAIGFGDMLAFSGGKAVKGVWLKEALEKSVKFYTTEGEELVLNSGKTWIEVLPEEVQIEYH